MIKDNFGQEININDEVVWGNKLPGRGILLEKCIVRGFTKTEQVRLETISNGKIRNAMFSCSIGKVNLADGDIQVGDFVIYVVNYGTQFVIGIGVVEGLTPKKIKLVRIGYEDRGTTLINRDFIAKISAAEKDRLRNSQVPYDEEQSILLNEYFDRLSASGENPFVRKGNTLVTNPNI